MHPQATIDRLQDILLEGELLQQALSTANLSKNIEHHLNIFSDLCFDWFDAIHYTSGIHAFFAAATSAGYSKLRDHCWNIFDFERMELYVAPRPAALISLAMRSAEHSAYLAQTVPVDSGPGAPR